VRRITAIVEDPLFECTTSVSDNQKTESVSGREIAARNVTLHALELQDLLARVTTYLDRWPVRDVRPHTR
jgi:hypothetical protein